MSAKPGEKRKHDGADDKDDDQVTDEKQNTPQPVADDDTSSLYATVCPAIYDSPVEIACNGKVIQLPTTRCHLDDAKQVADHLASAGQITVGVCNGFYDMTCLFFAEMLCSATIKAIPLKGRRCWACTHRFQVTDWAIP